MGELMVTAHLDTPSVGLLEHPVMLDGPLAWAYFQQRAATGEDLPPITDEYAADATLPLETWEQGGTWGWCVSRAHLDITAYGAFELRRKPATGPMSRYTTEREHHSGLGPQKARNVTLASAWVSTASWNLLCTDRGRLEGLLGAITHLGQHASRDMGRIAEWEVSPGIPNGWRDRPLPEPGSPVQAYRPPYWHASRKVVTTC